MTATYKQVACLISFHKYVTLFLMQGSTVHLIGHFWYYVKFYAHIFVMTFYVILPVQIIGLYSEYVLLGRAGYNDCPT